MTREEIMQLNTDYLNNCESEHEMNELFHYILELQKQMQESKWIPVSEKLPKPKETENLIAKFYLIQNEYGDMMVARYDGIGWEQMYQHEYIEDEVVAWMSLPKPYNNEVDK